ncbi:MAG: VWA domain-containing protein [Methylovulum sp.]|nr:VWA domain-containing protein [Methylovulum sp.]
MADFHFIRPLMLLGLAPLMALVVLLWRSKLNQGIWTSVCDEALLPYLLQEKAGRPVRGLLGIGAIAASLAVIALAGPTWRQVALPAFRNASAVVIALDLSGSMDAQDIKPSRLVRARYKIADLLRQRKDGQTALLVYAGAAFTVTPLTDDTQTIDSQLSALTTDIMPSAGSDTQAAIAKAVDLFKQAGLQKGQIILVTDGIDASDLSRVIKTLGSYQLSVLGVGTADGAPVPKADGGFVKDRQGGIIIPKMDAALLKQLVQAGHGVYQTISADDSDIKALLATLNQAAQPDDKSNNDVRVAVWDDEGPWLLLLVLPLAALGFRKGVLAIGFLLLLPLPQNSYALGWQDVWQTPDQQAQQKYRQRRYAEAAQQFTDSQWKAAAHYQAGEYDKAVQAYQAAPQPGNADYFYNLGNALAQAGQLEAALKAYDQALTIKPDDADSQYARDVVAKELAKPKPKPEQNDQQSQQDDKKSADDKSQPDEKSGQQQDGQQAQDNADNQQKPETKPERPSDDRAGQPSQDSQKPSPQPNKDKMSEQAAKAVQQATQKPAADKAQKPEAAVSVESAEQQQANEQWLKRIPDDPAGLLKRKFKYQYGRRAAQADEKDRD